MCASLVLLKNWLRMPSIHASTATIWYTMREKRRSKNTSHNNNDNNQATNEPNILAFGYIVNFSSQFHFAWYKVTNKKNNTYFDNFLYDAIELMWLVIFLTSLFSKKIFFFWLQMLNTNCGVYVATGMASQSKWCVFVRSLFDLCVLWSPVQF